MANLNGRSALKKVIDLVEEMGGEVGEIEFGKHFKVRIHRRGVLNVSRLLVVSGSPSDHRVLLKNKTIIRRLLAEMGQA